MKKDTEHLKRSGGGSFSTTRKNRGVVKILKKVSHKWDSMQDGGAIRNTQSVREKDVKGSIRDALRISNAFMSDHLLDQLKKTQEERDIISSKRGGFKVRRSKLWRLIEMQDELEEGGTEVIYPLPEIK